MTAGWMLFSCTSDELGEEDIAQGSEVQFATSDISRASVTTETDVTGSTFAVYGDMKFMKEANPTPVVIFNNTEVKYSSYDGWKYDGQKQYWFPNHEHSFIAMHPAGTGSPSYSNSTLSFTYTLPDHYADTPDILMATHRRMYKDEASSPATPVRLSFFHILSRVNFMLKDDKAADIVRVTKIELEGVNHTGTFTITPAPLLSGSGQTDDYTLFWTGISNKGTLTANISVDVPENKTCPLFPDNNALFVIPQPDNQGVIMKITYTLIDAGTKDEELTLTAETPIGGWETGKVYTYSMTVSEITKEIYLTVSVKDWQTANYPDITVPES